MDETNANTAITSAIAEELARCGMRQAVICPGSRSAPLALAFERNEAIEVEIVIDERSAGFLALGKAMSSGAPVAVITTSGSAVANLMPAVVESDEASVPLILLTADRPPELRDVGAGQTINQIGIFGTSVRWFCEAGIQPADDTGLLHSRSLACRAWTEASGLPRPGPVHVNLAFREPLAPTPDPDSSVTATRDSALRGRGARPLTRVLGPAVELDAAVTDEVASLIAKAERPLLVAGMNRSGEEISSEVGRFAEATSMPVLAEPTSQLRWSDIPGGLLVSAYDLIARAAPSDLTPDLVLRVGDPPTSKALKRWLSSEDRIEQFVIDPTGSWKEPSRSADTVLRADPGLLFAALGDRLAVLPSKDDWVESWADAEKKAIESAETILDAGEEPAEPLIWRALADVLSDGDRVFAASSMPVRNLESFMPPGSAQVRFFANRGANGIDGQIATAAGISAECIGKTYAVIGDLAFAHDLGSLQLLRHHPRLKLIVLDNGGGGIFDFLPVKDAIPADEMDRLFTTPSGLKPAEIARTMGLVVAQPSTQAEVTEALQGESNFVCVETDRAANLALHREIAREVSSLLS